MALDAEQGYKASLLDAGLSASKFIKRTPRTQRDYAHCPGGCWLPSLWLVSRRAGLFQHQMPRPA